MRYKPIFLGAIIAIIVMSWYTSVSMNYGLGCYCYDRYDNNTFWPGQKYYLGEKFNHTTKEGGCGDGLPFHECRD